MRGIFFIGFLGIIYLMMMGALLSVLYLMSKLFINEFGVIPSLLALPFVLLVAWKWQQRDLKRIFGDN